MPPARAHAAPAWGEDAGRRPKCGSPSGMRVGERAWASVCACGTAHGHLHTARRGGPGTRRPRSSTPAESLKAPRDPSQSVPLLLWVPRGSGRAGRGWGSLTTSAPPAVPAGLLLPGSRAQKLRLEGVSPLSVRIGCSDPTAHSNSLGIFTNPMPREVCWDLGFRTRTVLGKQTWLALPSGQSPASPGRGLGTCISDAPADSNVCDPHTWTSAHRGKPGKSEGQS